MITRQIRPDQRHLLLKLNQRMVGPQQTPQAQPFRLIPSLYQPNLHDRTRAWFYGGAR